jgi:hypothetical protein
MGTKWTPEEDQILREKRETMKPTELAVLLNRSVSSVRNRIYHLRLARVWNYKYYTNHDYFEHLTEESAYWLGFIYADGCIKPEHNALVVEVQLGDKDHLLRLQSAIGGSFKQYKRPSVILQVNSKKMYKDLLHWGVTPRKSLTCTFPELEEHLIPHFIRGYVDGDGCIYKYDLNRKRGKPKIALNVVGTKSFLEDLCNYLPNSPNVHSVNNIFKFTSYNLKAIENLTWIHQNSSLCLDRKWSKLTALSLQD